MWNSRNSVLRNTAHGNSKNEIRLALKTEERVKKTVVSMEINRAARKKINNCPPLQLSPTVPTGSLLLEVVVNYLTNLTQPIVRPLILQRGTEKN